MKKYLLLLFLLFSIQVFSIDLDVQVMDKDIDIPLEGVSIKYINLEENSEELHYTDETGKATIIFTLKDLPINLNNDIWWAAKKNCFWSRNN